MNCKKAAQLIPLFIEADLETAAMQSLTEHLEACDSCRCVAKEFQASQSLLHSVALPEFSENTFVQMRSSVLNEIARPKISDLLHPIWNWKTAFAASLAMITLMSGIVIYRLNITENIVAQTPRTSDKKHEFSAVASSKDLVKPSSVSSKVLKPRRGRKNIAQGEVSGRERNPGKIGTNHSSPERAIDIDNEIITAKSVAPFGANDLSANIPRGATLGFMLPPASQAENAAAQLPEPEMLRIEIQTADPNIKIIWLAPKDTNSSRTGTAADTK